MIEKCKHCGLEYYENLHPVCDEQECALPRSAIALRAAEWLREIADMLLVKNAAYGDSASNPVRIFSKAAAGEAVRVRIDDKLSRIARGSNAGEDTLKDLVGYLALLAVMK